MSLTFTRASANRVNVGQASSLDNLPAGGAMTLMLWVYRTDNGTNQTIIAKDGSFTQGWNFTVTDDNGEGTMLFFVWRSTNSEAKSNSTSANRIPLNTWTCVGVVFEEAAGQRVKFFIGNQTTTIAEVSGYTGVVNGTGTPGNDGSIDLYIGNIVRSGTAYAPGARIGPTAVFNRVLTVGEMQAWQHDPKMMAGCVGLWNLGDNGTGTQPDYSGNGNNGTVTGATQSDNPPLRRRWGRALTPIVLKAAPTAYTLTASSGSFALTGTAATLKAGRVLSAASGTFTETGTAATLKAGRRLTAASGAFTETGTAATLKVGRLLSAASGTYTLTGTAATLKSARRLTAASGTYVLTGTDATLSYSGTPARTLTASSGAFTFTGSAATLKVGRVLSAASASYALTGTAATLKWAHRLTASSGAFTHTGSAASLLYGRRLIASGASYTLTGTAATLRAARRLVATAGTYVLTGMDAALRYSAAIIVSTAYYVTTRSGARYSVTERSEPRYRVTRRE